MLYLAKVYVLVMAVVFGFSGMIMLIMFGFHQAKDYARARGVMSGIAAGQNREMIAKSRTISRLHDQQPVRVA